MEVKNEKQIEYKSGATRSDRTGRGRFDLISPYGLMELAKVYEEGAKQKGERNWEQGFPISRCIDSALRHISQYAMGMRDERHLAQAVWQLFAIIHFEALIAAGKLSVELNDMPAREALPDIWYFAHPYSGDEKENFRKCCQRSAELIKRGYTIFSPITHSHPIEMTDRKLTGPLWYQLDNAIIKTMPFKGIILAPDWTKSRGCLAELKLFQELGRQVHLYDAVVAQSNL